MGGHYQTGAFNSLQEAVHAWYEARRKCEDDYHLYFQYGEITYSDKDHKYRIAMRFTK